MVKTRKNSFITTSIIVFIVGIIIVGLSLVTIIDSGKEVNKKQKIKIWTLYGDINKVLEKVTSDYERNNPNVYFEIEAFKNEEYKEVIERAVMFNEAPDMFFAWGDKYLEEYVKKDAIEEITNVYEESEFVNMLRPNVLNSCTIDNKLYGIPISGWSLVLYINEDIFNNNNIKIPENYKEFLSAIKSFNELGITPMTVGAEEEWTLSFLYMYLALENVGIEGVREAIADNRKFNQEGFLEAAKQFEEIRDLGAFKDNVNNTNSYNSDFAFRRGEAAMTLTGTWIIPLIERDFAEDPSVPKFNVKIINLLEGDKSIKGYNDSFVINKNSKQIEVIESLYVELMKGISDEYIINYNGGLPVWKNQIISKEKSELLFNVIESTKNDEFHSTYDQALDYKMKEVHLENIKLLFNKEITAEEFIENHTK